METSCSIHVEKCVNIYCFEQSKLFSICSVVIVQCIIGACTAVEDVRTLLLCFLGQFVPRLFVLYLLSILRLVSDVQRDEEQETPHRAQWPHLPLMTCHHCDITSPSPSTYQSLQELINRKYQWSMTFIIQLYVLLT